MILKENLEHVVSDLIDGEMVLLHMGAGNYYSLGGVGITLWKALQRGVDSVSLQSSLIATYPETPDQELGLELERWLEELKTENLIIEHGTSDPDSLSVLDFPKSYQTPELTKYSDLQDLLLLDPVHDADPEVGWPAQRD